MNGRKIFVWACRLAILGLVLVSDVRVYAGALISLSVNPGQVTGGTTATGQVTVAGCATPDCEATETVNLSSSDPSVASVPASLEIPLFGKDPVTSSFQIETYPVSTAKSVTITAEKGGNVRSVQLRVCPANPALSGLELDPGLVTGGSPSSLTLSLDCAAPAGGVQVDLSSGFPSVVTVPDSVVIPAGEQTHTFTDAVLTYPVNIIRFVVISGAANGGAENDTLTVTPGGQNLNLAVHKHGVEVTQAVQCFGGGICGDNALPLVQGKATAVRVYIEMSGTASPISNVRGTLQSRPCGTSDQWTIHPPLWSGAALIPPINDEEHLQAQRASPALPGDPARNLTFLVDQQYLSGGCLDFRAEINPDHTIQEVDYADNTRLLTNVEFQPTRNLRVKFVRIKFYPQLVGGPHFTPGWSTIDPMIEYIKKIYPVSEVNYSRASKDIVRRWENFNVEQNWWHLLVNLAARQLLSGESGMHYYGIFDEEVPHLCCGGMAWLPPLQKVGAGHAGHVGTGIYQNSARTFAHEISHNVGREHAPCGDPDGIDPSWPDTTNPDAIIGTVGFDIQRGVALSSTVFSDIMSYCKEQWISPYTYEAVFEAFGPSSQAQAAPPEGEPAAVSQGDYLVASGVISESQQVALDSFLRTELPTGVYDGAGSGLYTLVLRAADGSPLVSRHFDPGDYHGAAGRGPFFEVLPYDPATAQIDVVVQGFAGPITLASRTVSANPPQVQLTYPDGGESLGATERFTVTWTGSDPDGDALSYALLYSRDGGASWEALDTGLQQTTYALDAADLPGSDQALMRVMASDGVNTAQDESQAVFFLEDKGPQVEILFPGDQERFEPGTALLLKGNGYDVEDGQLSGAALTWTSDRDGTLGSGEELVASLSPGVHTITLEGADSDGNRAASTARLFSGDPTTTTILSDTPDPSQAGEPFTVTVSVTSTTRGPTGVVTVTVIDDPGTCSATLDGGRGDCVLTLSTPGVYTLNAEYDGGEAFAPSSATEVHTVAPAQALPTTTTILSDAPDPSQPGEPFTVTFGVTGTLALPTGVVTVTVSDDPGSCSDTLSGGVGACALVLSTPGAYTLTAAYGGDGTLTPSMDTEAHTVLASSNIRLYLPLVLR